MGGFGTGNRALGYLRILELQGDDVVSFAVFNGRGPPHDLRSSGVVASSNSLRGTPLGVPSICSNR